MRYFLFFILLMAVGGCGILEMDEGLGYVEPVRAYYSRQVSGVDTVESFYRLSYEGTLLMGEAVRTDTTTNRQYRYKGDSAFCAVARGGELENEMLFVFDQAGRIEQVGAGRRRMADIVYASGSAQIVLHKDKGKEVIELREELPVSWTNEEGVVEDVLVYHGKANPFYHNLHILRRAFGPLSAGESRRKDHVLLYFSPYLIERVGDRNWKYKMNRLGLPEVRYRYSEQYWDERYGY